jgi:hypothetical protein
MNKINAFIALCLIVVLLLGSFVLGKKLGGNQIEKKFIDNVTMARNIAQLTSYEVNGIAKMKTTNADNSGMIASVRTYFTENTMLLDVPYTAKYGVDLDKKLKITQSDSSIEIILPMPELLSLELRMDKCEAFSKKGMLVMDSDKDLLDMSKELYREQRAALEHSSEHIEKSKLKLIEIFKIYYAPFTQNIHVVFDNQDAAITITKPELK